MAYLYRLSNRDSRCKTDEKSRREYPKQNHCQNPVKLEKNHGKLHNNLLSLLRVEQVVRFHEDDDWR
jgi:hypothetical protein